MLKRAAFRYSQIAVLDYGGRGERGGSGGGLDVGGGAVSEDPGDCKHLSSGGC